MRLTKNQLKVVRLVANNFRKIKPEDIQPTMLACLIRKRVLGYNHHYDRTVSDTRIGVFKEVHKHFKLIDAKYKIK